MPNLTKRVMIITSHKMILRGISLLVKGSENAEIVASAKRLDEFAGYYSAQPDIVIVDNSIESTSTIQEIRENLPHVWIVALVDFIEELSHASLLDSGATYIVQKKHIVADLLAIIQSYKHQTSDHGQLAAQTAHCGRPFHGSR